MNFVVLLPVLINGATVVVVVVLAKTKQTTMEYHSINCYALETLGLGFKEAIHHISTYQFLNNDMTKMKTIIFKSLQ